MVVNGNWGLLLGNVQGWWWGSIRKQGQGNWQEFTGSIVHPSLDMLLEVSQQAFCWKKKYDSFCFCCAYIKRTFFFFLFLSVTRIIELIWLLTLMLLLIWVGGEMGCCCRKSNTSCPYLFFLFFSMRFSFGQKKKIYPFFSYKLDTSFLCVCIFFFKV